MPLLHDLGAELWDGTMLRAWCLCGQPFRASCGSYRRSRRAALAALDDHAGFANAAGLSGQPS